jgi:hypothetical protein
LDTFDNTTINTPTGGRRKSNTITKINCSKLTDDDKIIE